MCFPSLPAANYRPNSPAFLQNMPGFRAFSASAPGIFSYTAADTHIQKPFFNQPITVIDRNSITQLNQTIIVVIFQPGQIRCHPIHFLGAAVPIIFRPTDILIDKRMGQADSGDIGKALVHHEIVTMQDMQKVKFSVAAPDIMQAAQGIGHLWVKSINPAGKNDRQPDRRSAGAVPRVPGSFVPLHPDKHRFDPSLEQSIASPFRLSNLFSWF